MHRIYMAGLFLFFLCAATSAQTRPDGRKEKLAGPVQAVRVETAAFAGEPGKVREGPRHLHASFRYDTMGNLTEAIYYDKGGAITNKHLMRYNTAGVKVEETNYKAKESLSSRTVFTPDASGRVVEEEVFDDKGQLTDKFSFAYDAAGRETERRHQDKKAGESTTRYKYDASGRLIEQTSSDDKGNVTQSVIYTYGPEGMRAEATDFKDQKSVRKVVRIYDAKARKTEISLYSTGDVLAWQRRFTYDDRGNTVGDEYKGTGLYAKWDYAYEFDAAGNWTKLTKSQWYQISGKPMPIPQMASYRTISYYPQAYMPASSTSPAVDEPQPGYVSGGVLQGEALRRIEPNYPLNAKVSHTRGTVVVEVTVDEEGNVANARIISGSSVFHEACLSAASQWKFLPTLLSGMPVKVVGTITFNFHI
jgi:TonB family protein